MAFGRHDISGTSYVKKMDEKIAQYNGLIRRAERINYDMGGKPTKDEATFYYQASKVCEEIMNMNISERAVHNQWNIRKLDCESEVRRITDIIAPPPPTPKKPEPAEQPARNTIPAEQSSGKKQAVKGETKSGFKTKNACKDVTAETIEKWYREIPEKGFEHLSGMEDLKQMLMSGAASMGWSRTDELLGISPVRSYFLYGPPGTGKTSIIEAFACEMKRLDKDFKFIQLMGGDIHASLVGVAEKTVEIAFQEAIDNAPCLLFIDEIDNVCTNRDSHAESHEKKLTVAFLQAYNKLKSSGARVIFMGATNHPAMVDEAMLDRINLIKVPLPGEEAREKFFAKSFGNLTLAEGFTTEDMAQDTDNYSYRDMNKLKEAIADKIKNQAIALHRIVDESGVLNQADSDRRASEAIESGEISLTRDMFEETQREIPPSEKSKIQEELRIFEDRARKLV